MDPVFIVLIGVLVCGGLLKCLELGFASWQEKEIASGDYNPPIMAATKDIYVCEVYETRLLEKKLLNAGIIEKSEMTVCDNPECANCFPDYKPLSTKDRNNTLGTIFSGNEIRTNNKALDNFSECGHWTPTIGDKCKRCRAAANIRLLGDLDRGGHKWLQYDQPEEIQIESGDGTVIKKYSQYQPSTSSRVTKLGDYTLVRPFEVPESAKANVFIDYSKSLVDITWSWKSYKSPSSRGGYRDRISKEMFDAWQRGEWLDHTEVYDPEVELDQLLDAAPKWEPPPGIRPRKMKAVRHTRSTGPE